MNQLFGSLSGLGMSAISFDWSQISFIGSPLASPWWAEANIFGGFVFFYWFLTPILYVSGLLPFASGFTITITMIVHEPILLPIPPLLRPFLLRQHRCRLQRITDHQPRSFPQSARIRGLLPTLPPYRLRDGLWSQFRRYNGNDRTYCIVLPETDLVAKPKEFERAAGRSREAYERLSRGAAVVVWDYIQ